MNGAATGEEMGIAGTKLQGEGEVVDRLGKTPHVVKGVSALVIGFGVVRCLKGLERS